MCYTNYKWTHNINCRYFVTKSDLKSISTEEAGLVGRASNEYFEMTDLRNEKYE